MGLVVALVGAAGISVGSYRLFRALRIRRGGVRTQGTVIGNRATFDSSGQGTYSPVIRFAPPDGRIVEFDSRVSSRVAYEEGTQVPVVYRPSKPEDAVLATALGTWLVPTWFLVLGVVALLAGLIWFVFYPGVTLPRGE